MSKSKEDEVFGECDNDCVFIDDSSIGYTGDSNISESLMISPGTSIMISNRVPPIWKNGLPDQK